MKTSLQTPFSSYKIRKLEINEKVKSFDCGDADLNDFILNESGFIGHRTKRFFQWSGKMGERL